MVIGNGMIAKAFTCYDSDERILLFASGVSNSRTTDTREFERERSLLARTLAEHGAKLFVYISTCSIADREVSHTPYVIHKMAMEGMVARDADRYLVLRLPQVVGRSSNPYTLVNYLHDRIMRGERFAVWRNTVRYLIDVEDVVRMTEYIIDHTTLRNTVLNIVSRHYTVPDILAAVEKIAGKKANCEMVDKGEPYRLDDILSSQIAETLSIKFEEPYLESTIRKYYQKST